MNKIEWSIKVSIFKNPIILRQLGLAIGIPFGSLILILLVLTKEVRYTLYALGLIFTLFFVTYIFIRLIYGGKYALRYTIDNNGIYSYTDDDQRKKNSIINKLTIILGIFSRKPTVIGSGVLANSRQNSMIKWRNIRRIKLYPRYRTIMVYGVIGENIGIFCSKENYDEVEWFIKSKLK